MRYSGVTPEDNMWILCYLDDLNVRLRVPRARLHCRLGHDSHCPHGAELGPLPDEGVLERATAAYEKAGLEMNEGKRYATPRHLRPSGPR